MLIPIKQYAEMHGRTPATVRQKCIRGTFTTAQKIGRDWLIDDQEPYTDARERSAQNCADPKSIFLKK